MADTPTESTFDLESYKSAAGFEEFLVVRLGRGEGRAVQTRLIVSRASESRKRVA